MADIQAPDPAVPGTLATDGAPGQGGSVLTGEKPAADGTPPLAESATPQKPPAWMAQLPKDLQADASLTRYTTIGDLGKAYKELEGKIGKALFVPGKDATDEEKARFRASLGVPAKPEDYKAGEVKLPQGYELNKDAQEKLKQLSHAAALTPSQFDVMSKFFALREVQAMAESARVVKTTADQARESLSQAYGSDLNQPLSLMKRGIDRFVSEQAGLTKTEIAEIYDVLNRTGLGNHVGFIKAFVEIGKAISDHRFVQSSARGGGSEKSAEELLYPSMLKQ